MNNNLDAIATAGKGADINLSDVAAAAKGVAEYIERNGEEANLEIVVAQLKLASDRLLLVKMARLERVADMANDIVEEKALWGEL